MDQIRLECSVRGPPLPTGTSITIKWMRVLYSNNSLQNLDVVAREDPELLEVVTQNVNTQDSTNRFNEVRSILTLRNVIPNDVTGSYHCVAVVTVDSPRTETILSEESTMTIIRSQAEYANEDPCDNGGVVHRAFSTSCVSFSGDIPAALMTDSTSTMTTPRVEPTSMPSLPTPPPVSSTMSPSIVPRTTSPPLEGPGDISIPETLPPASQLLSPTMIIILASVGSALCIVIHVLLALVSCLWVKSRRKRRTRGESCENITNVTKGGVQGN